MRRPIIVQIDTAKRKKSRFRVKTKSARQSGMLVLFQLT